MAGGMNKRGNFGSMAERVAQSKGQEAPAPPVPAIKHCWVTDRHGRLPGLLLEWGRRESGFHGRVLHAVLEDGEWVVVEEWLPAELLAPIADQAQR
ncbi:MAG: hypothetical protein ACXVXM_10025 [Nocardioidaceae bacterium]